MKAKTYSLVLALISLFPLTSSTVRADETAGESVQGAARSAKVKTKKQWRSTKKSVRDATGNGSMKEDVKDGARNVGDSVDDSAKTMKDKVD